MCLGADVELSLTPACKPQPMEIDATVSSKPSAVSAQMLDDLIPLDPMDSDEEDIPLSVARLRVISPFSASPASAAPVSNAKRKKDSDILITLVHGDMLVLRGDEFEVRISLRSEHGIV